MRSSLVVILFSLGSPICSAGSIRLQADDSLFASICCRLKGTLRENLPNLLFLTLFETNRGVGTSCILGVTIASYLLANFFLQTKSDLSRNCMHISDQTLKTVDLVCASVSNRDICFYSEVKLTTEGTARTNLTSD